MLYVVKIVRHSVVRPFDFVDLTPQPIDLCPAGDARLDAMAVKVLLDDISVKLAARLHRYRVRARPDQRHVAVQHVDQLRQLVETQQPQDVTDMGDPRIALHRALRAGLVALIGIHRAKFEHSDDAIGEAKALLYEKNGPGAV